MNVEVRRYATLHPGKSGGLPGEPEEVVLPDGATVSDLLAVLHLPSDDVHLVIVNGRIAHDRSGRLADADRVAVFPPVGGG